MRMHAQTAASITRRARFPKSGLNTSLNGRCRRQLAA
jgi:hypothetical protein